MPSPDAMDTEMMETQNPSSQPQSLPDLASGSGSTDAVRDLLALARHLINQGNPTQALQTVVLAMKTKGGDEAVFQSLHRARELYRSRLQENAVIDQLASLFAECAIAEAQASNSELPPQNTVAGMVAPASNGTSILAESGRSQIVLDAFSDGSSFICLQCGGLVSNHRKDEHYAYWCCKI